MGGYATHMTKTALQERPKDGRVIWSGYFSDAVRLASGVRAWLGVLPVPAIDCRSPLGES